MLGIAMGICLMALAGLPPITGFMAKLPAFGAAVEAAINTALAFFYYLRVIMVLYSKQETILDITPPSQGTFTVVITAIFFVIGLGIFPEWLLGSLKLP
jgi:NADH-quinone oxidoreductase subunit N